MSDAVAGSLTASLRRLAGVLGLVGGLALAAAYLTHPSSAPPETVASTQWIWIHVGFMVSLLSGVFLLMILAGEFIKAGGGWPGVTGFAMSVTSLIFVFGLDYSEVFIFPTLAVEFPEVVTKYGDGTSMPSVAFAFPATGVLFVLGFILFALQLAKAGVISKGACWLTIAGTIVFGMGLSGLFPMIVVRIGSVIYGCGLTWLGLDLARDYRVSKAAGPRAN
jgi:hypothetical protein